MNHSMLYIEDNENNIFLVEALLKRRPRIELHVAMTSREGVRAALDKLPALISSTTASPTRPAAKSSATSPPRRYT